MAFVLGKKSKANLEGVHADLVKVVERAIQITTADFMVFEGLRSQERQKQLVASGASTTTNSRHLTGHAVDLVPYVDGGPRWDWPLCYEIALAVKYAAVEYGTPIIWGGVWDREMAALGDDMEEEVAKYVMRRKQAGKRAFTDGPHYQLPWDSYPLATIF